MLPPDRSLNNGHWSPSVTTGRIRKQMLWRAFQTLENDPTACRSSNLSLVWNKWGLRTMQKLMKWRKTLSSCMLIIFIFEEDSSTVLDLLSSVDLKLIKKIKIFGLINGKEMKTINIYKLLLIKHCQFPNCHKKTH